MDRLDKLSIILILGLGILTTSLIVKNSWSGSQSMADADAGRIASAMAGPDLTIYQGVEAKIKACAYAEALTSLASLQEQYPERKESSIYMAKIYKAQGDLTKAIPMYKKSIAESGAMLKLASTDLWGMVKEDIPKLQREQKLRPNDSQIDKLLKDLYYIQRKLGQGCE